MNLQSTKVAFFSCISGSESGVSYPPMHQLTHLIFFIRQGHLIHHLLFSFKIKCSPILTHFTTISICTAAKEVTGVYHGAPECRPNSEADKKGRRLIDFFRNKSARFGSLTLAPPRQRTHFFEQAFVRQGIPSF
jgi:hypothetical protein